MCVVCVLLLLVTRSYQFCKTVVMIKSIVNTLVSYGRQCVGVCSSATRTSATKMEMTVVVRPSAAPVVVSSEKINNTHEAAVALLPLTTHPQSWVEPHIHIHTGKPLPSVPHLRNITYLRNNITAYYNYSIVSSPEGGPGSVVN